MMKFLIAGTAIAVGLANPPVPEKTKEPEIQPIPVTSATWKCPDCTPEEKYVLSELQRHTKISDRNALATIMGNI